MSITKGCASQPMRAAWGSLVDAVACSISFLSPILTSTAVMGYVTVSP